MIRKLVLGAALAAGAMGANFAITTAAFAGEGHWSIGHGVQCRIIAGKVVCTKNRP